MVGGVIEQLTPGGLAEEMGLGPGDRLVSIDGQPVRDILDYRFLIASEHVELEVHRPDGQVWLLDVEKEPDETLGVVFASDLFDGMKRCQNRCLFCFVDQLPRGLRSSLYVKDDDFRLSFLHGNFVTMTNLGPGDLDRIREQRLSPLYVSVHATDARVRGQMLGRGSPDDIMGILRELKDAGISVHAQVVLCPGLNDGGVLGRTVDDLSSLYPSVRSVGVVPVGLTGHRSTADPVGPVDPLTARMTIDLISTSQRKLRQDMGTRFVYAADEMYLLARMPLPPVSEYESFPQLDNGIGSWRFFERSFKRRVGREPALEGTVATGLLAAPLLSDLLGGVRVVSVPNGFLGESVTVAGLMSGSDLAAALTDAGIMPGERVLIPATAVQAQEGKDRFLDGVDLDWVRQRTGAYIQPVPPVGRSLADALMRKEWSCA